LKQLNEAYEVASSQKVVGNGLSAPHNPRPVTGIAPIKYIFLALLPHALSLH
jgi:hypothetical protein